VDVAYGGVEAAIDVVKEIKAKLVTATEQGVDKTKVQEEITQLQDQLKSIGASASFNGENWLAGGASDATVVTGFVRDTGGTVKVTTASYDAESNSLFGAYDSSTGEVGTTDGILKDVLAIDLSSASDSDVAGFLDNVETALTDMEKVGSTLGSLSKRISLQEDFAQKLSDAIDKGVGRL